MVDATPFSAGVDSGINHPAVLLLIWASQGVLRGRVFWRQNDALPLHKGASVDWVFTGA